MSFRKNIITVSITAFAILPFTSIAQSVNPDVSQANIQNTVCSSGWTKTIRPTVSYTNKVKKQKCVEQKRNCTGLILDHIIPLEVGGHPTDPHNLKLQTSSESKAKDLLENKTKKEVCAGSLTLTEGQKRFQ